MIGFRVFTGVALCLAWSACKPSAEVVTVTDTPAQVLYKHGKSVYQSYCTSCHNSDPKKNGAVGPDVFGSSKELIEARVLRAAYPPGYTPKRKSGVMVALPYLKKDIDALYAYLNDLQ